MENRSGLGQAQVQAEIGVERVKADLLDRVGGWVAKLFTSTRGRSACNFLYSLICIIPRVLITNANRVCIVDAGKEN